MFKTRLISGIVLVALALVTIISGGEILFATTWLICGSCTGPWEFTGKRQESWS